MKVKKAISLTLSVWMLLYVTVTAAAAGDNMQGTPRNAAQMVKVMGRGTNLGNTFEGNWNPRDYESVKKTVDAFIDAGYTNIRIPVNWGGRKPGDPMKADADGIIDTDNSEVVTIKKLVDYVLLEVNPQRKSAGKPEIVLIINAHHEEWFMQDVLGSENYGSNIRRLENIWQGICELFADEPDTLLFEVFNEPHIKLDKGEDAKKTVIDMNKRIYNIIRNDTAGGKKLHEKRIVVFSGINYNSGWGLIDTYDSPDKIPGGTKDAYVMATYHSYYAKIEDLINRAKNIDNDFSRKFGIPVYVGEWGVNHKDGIITQELLDYYRQAGDELISHGFAFSVWDDNGWFKIYKRSEGTFYPLKEAALGLDVGVETPVSTPTPTPTPKPAEQAPVAPQNQGEIGIVLDGNPLHFTPTPVMVNDRVLVPMRGIFEALGATVQWNESTGTVRAIKNDTEVILTIGKTEANISDRVVQLDVAPILLEDRTMVPLRFVSEALGCSVEWDEVTQTVNIESVK